MTDWRPFIGPQAEFCSRGEFEVLFGGTKGPGKTDCLIMEATRHVHNEKYHALILRRTFPRLQEIIDRCHMWYPKIGGQYRATEHRWYFPTGARITLGHCQNEEDKRNYHGKEFHFIGFDELTEFTETQYLFILANVRRTQQELGLRIRATTNPGGVGHVWVKKRFIDYCKPTQYTTYVNEDGEERTMAVPVVYFDPESQTSRCFVPATVYDNLYIQRYDPGYVNRLRGLPPAERKRLLDGIWDVYEDQAFPELLQRVHGCDPFPVPPEWEKFCVMDWGYAKPFAIGWYALDFDGILYRYREWYGCKPDTENVGLRMTPIDVARGIIEREREKVRFRVADPACWSHVPRRDQTLGPSIVEDMAKEGLFWVKADNNRLLGKMQMHERFKLEQVTDDDGEITSEYPRFLAFNDQAHFWRTMTKLQIDVKNPEDVDTEQEDHCFVYDTEIITENGVSRIGDLVGTTGKVLTIGGKYTTYWDCRKTGRRNDLVKVSFEDGSSVYCTQDHKFMVENYEWREAKALTNVLSYVIIAQPINKEIIKCESTSLARQFRSLMDCGITNAETTFRKMASDCMLPFGSIFMGRSIKDARSIIKTMTDQIIRLGTSYVSPDENIAHAMRNWQIMQAGLHLCTEGPLNGTGVQRVSTGIESTIMSIAERKSTPLLKKNASSVEVCSVMYPGRNSAQINANRNGDEQTTSMTKFEYARFAGRNTKPASIQKIGPVLSNVAENYRAGRNILKVISVEPAGKADVYCLVADETHAFALKNGAIVSNCYDEVRYAMMARPIIPKRTNVMPTNTFRAERDRMIKAKKYALRHGVSIQAAYARNTTRR